jgi:hypothetical protein
MRSALCNLPSAKEEQAIFSIYRFIAKREFRGFSALETRTGLSSIVDIRAA